MEDGFTNWSMQNMGAVSSMTNLQGMEFTDWPENTTGLENMQGCLSRDWTMEMDASVHSMDTASMREYWAAKKREQRRKERESSRLQDPSLMDEAKSRKQICSAMAKFWRKKTLGLTRSIQRELFQQLLLHPTFKDLQTSTASVESTLLSNIRNTLGQLKVPRSTHELFLKRSSLTMVMNNTDGTTQMNHTRIAGILGVHRRNIAAASSRLEIKDDEEVLPLSACQRQLPQGNIVTGEVRDLVYAFWSSETRVSPNKKDICRKRIGRKSVVKHPVHLLDDSQVNSNRC